jgi:hypothetical protein
MPACGNGQSNAGVQIQLLAIICRHCSASTSQPVPRAQGPEVEGLVRRVSQTHRTQPASCGGASGLARHFRGTIPEVDAGPVDHPATAAGLEHRHLDAPSSTRSLVRRVRQITLLDRVANRSCSTVVTLVRRPRSGTGHVVATQVQSVSVVSLQQTPLQFSYILCTAHLDNTRRRWSC